MMDAFPQRGMIAGGGEGERKDGRGREQEPGQGDELSSARKPRKVSAIEWPSHDGRRKILIWFPRLVQTALSERVGDLAEFCRRAIEEALERRGIDLPEPHFPLTAPQYRGKESLLRRVLVLKRERLSPQEAQILRLRAGLVGGRPHSLREIARKLGTSHTRVWQLERRALRKLGLAETFQIDRPSSA